MKKLLLLLVFAPLLVGAQSRKQKRAIEEQRKADEKILNNLKTHIAYLSDDKLEGRRAGSKGEQMAMQYITEQFENIGLQPYGSAGYVQAFPVNMGKKVDKTSYFGINGKPLKIESEYIPLAFSANKPVKGSAAITFREAGEPWFADVKEWLDEAKANPHYSIDLTLAAEALKVAAKGATALIVFNSGDQIDNIGFNKRDTTSPSPIPVVYITRDGFNKYFADKSATLDIELKVQLNKSDFIAHNIAGYINNNADNTVVVGAHYDHLGWGEDENALDTGRAVHNGADDNASGTAALIELAKMLKTSAIRNNNYLFIAFSAEELGLLGSKYWLENTAPSAANLNYMINLDMIGRYMPEHKLTIAGYGTSPVWGSLFSTMADKNLVIKFDSTGGGPSDHAAFYHKNIPVLFFFTGTHTDYHKATDDWDKINYSGEVGIVRYVLKVIQSADNKGKLAFLKTAEPQMARTQFTVTLGIMPDYAFTGSGLRVDGIIPNKLAESVGLRAGDILLQLGGYKINEINSYMKALASFKKGDKTTLRYTRDNAEKITDVEFNQ